LKHPGFEMHLERAAALACVLSCCSQHLRFDISLDGGTIAASFGQAMIVH